MPLKQEKTVRKYIFSIPSYPAQSKKQEKTKYKKPKIDITFSNGKRASVDGPLAKSVLVRFSTNLFYRIDPEVNAYWPVGVVKLSFIITYTKLL